MTPLNIKDLQNFNFNPNMVRSGAGALHKLSKKAHHYFNKRKPLT